MSKAIEDLLASVIKNMPDEQAKMLAKDLKVANQWGITMFNPHPKQDKFHRSKAHIRLFQGGNRSGKSTSGCKETVAFMLGYRPWLSKNDPDYKTPMKTPVVGRIICEDFGVTAAQVIIKKLKEDIPPGMIAKGYPRKNSDGIEVEWMLTNGSYLQILSNKQDTKIFEGADLDFCWADEPPDRDKYIATLRGMVDRGGYMWLTMTPLSQPWIYDEIEIKSATDPDVFCIYVDINDNVGYGLSKNNVDRFASSLREDEKEMRLHGKHRRLLGLVYKEFSPEKHIIDPFEISPKWPKYVLIDPHPRTPHMVSWFTVDPYDRIIQYDELFEHMLISELCRVVRAKNGNNRIISYHCDPIAFQENPLDKRRWADEFIEHGIPVQPAPKQLSYGITKVKDFLEGNELMGPQMYFFRTLQHTLWEIQRYRWDDWKGSSSEEKNEKQKPVDKDDHAMENLYRAVLVKPNYRDISHDDQPLQYPKADVF